MPRGVPGPGKMKIQVVISRTVYRAFKVYCLLEEKDEGGTVSLALARFLEATGNPQVKQLIREEEKK